MPDDTSRTEPTHYKILGLYGHPANTLSKQDVKAAYHRTLLRYHPDKINTLNNKEALAREDEESYTIDEITDAYNTLASPVTRAAYDKQLESLPTRTNGKLTKETLHNGVEIHDLEDLVYDVDKDVWSRGCRCGDPYGYVLTETELERESSEGEIYVACKGCSLWIKVLFGTTESDRETDGEHIAKQRQQ
jgi:diphthamide biosynthesis protein 4